MKITSIAQSVQTQEVQKKGRKPDAPPVQQNGDKVEISSKARELAESNSITEAASGALKDSTDVRSDKIAEARDKIAEGFYNQDNVSSALADRLLKEFGL